MSSPLPHALTGSGPLSGVLRAVLSVVVLVGAAVLALFALVLTWAVTLGVAVGVLLRAAFARRAPGGRTGGVSGEDPRTADAGAPEDEAGHDTARELEAFHGSLEEFMRRREGRDG